MTKVEDAQFLEQIITISRRMAEIRDANALMAYIMEQALQLASATQGCIVLYQPDAQLDFRISHSRTNENLTYTRDKISKTILRHVVTTSEPIVIQNATTHPLFYQADSVQQLDLRSIMCVPLIARGHIIGAIYVENLSLRTQFKEGDAGPFMLFANQAAVSIENAIHHQQLQQQVDNALTTSNHKSEMLARVSHDLRTPLNVIQGYIEILRTGLHGDLSEEQIWLLREIMDSTHFLTNLVDELVDQSQLEAGHLTLRLAEFAPADIINPIQAKMLILAQAKDLTLTSQIDPTLPSKICGDQKRLQQILFNLVGNAIKFTDEGNIHISLYRPDEGHWAIQVADTGHGIAPEMQAQIFKPFWQLENPTKLEQQGVGLGLSIVQELAHLMKGHIVLHSQLGQGSTFTVVLPLVFASPVE